MPNRTTLKTYYNREAGYQFSYPSRLYLEYLEGQQSWASQGEDILQISIKDTSQKQYIYESNVMSGRPQGLFAGTVEEMQRLYPEYHIRVLVSKDPSLYMLSFFPPSESRRETEEISIGNQIGATYVAEERPPTHDTYTYSKVTAIKLYDFQYAIQYECVCGPTGIKKKYLPLYYNIISTMRFFAPPPSQTPKSKYIQAPTPNT